MSWPLPQDINEIVQFPRTAFSDPDLAASEAVVGTTGLPLPRSGNFADLYQLRGADGREWAVKCFTRPVTGLDVRYSRIGQALSTLDLSFAVEFEYLDEGIRVNGKWYPAVKMQWVEGLLLNQFVRENAVRPAILDGMVGIWSRLAKRLRECGLAHGDIQHGNVLLVSGQRSGSIGVKLIDYDGMYTKGLANLPSGEAGHSAYQHPLRAAYKIYSPDLDRFPHLVVATAMKALAVFGPSLWDKYDTGDNLLFTEADFKNPAGSDLFRELWQTNDHALRGLVGRLAAAAKKPMTQTPWLDAIAPNGVVVALTPAEEAEASSALGVTVATVPATPVASPVSTPAADFADFVEDEPPTDAPEKTGKRKRPRRSGGLLGPVLAVAGLFVIGGSVAGLYFAFGPKSDKPVAEATAPNPDPVTLPPATSGGTTKPPVVPKDPPTVPVGIAVRDPGAAFASA